MIQKQYVIFFLAYTKITYFAFKTKQTFNKIFCNILKRIIY